MLVYGCYIIMTDCFNWNIQIAYDKTYCLSTHYMANIVGRYNSSHLACWSTFKSSSKVRNECCPRSIWISTLNILCMLLNAYTESYEQSHVL